MPIRFDDSLSVLVKVVVESLGEAAFVDGRVLRDVSGRLAYFHATPIPDDQKDAITSILKSRLGNYARSDRCLAGSNEIGVADVLHDTAPLVIVSDGITVRLIDRRLVGADWLRRPKEAANPPPRFVFASLKGGVGRSTALSVVAAQLASKGRSVLAVDVDMEAPGLGSMLLRQEELPPFGIIDALVENGFGRLDDQFMSDLIAPTRLSNGLGRVDVLPALGARSAQNPSNVMAKIARAYAEDIVGDGPPSTLLDQVSEIIDYFSNLKKYQAILVDARAGLHESSAAAILGLGAEVFFFGLNEQQTFSGYDALFCHLSQLIDPAVPIPSWLDGLTMVQGKAPADSSSRKEFAEKCEFLFEKTGLVRPLFVNSQNVPLPAEPFSDVPWKDDLDDDEDLLEQSGIQQTLAVLDDERFRLFNPLIRSDLLSTEICRSSFGALIDRVEMAMPNS